MLRKIFRWIPADTRKTVTHALVTSRLDYGNTLYAGTTAKLQNRLQRIQNASARLILNVPRNSHISAHLRHPLAPSQQKDHLSTSHPCTQSPPRQGTGIPQPTPQLLRPHPPPPFLCSRTRFRPSHPPLHGGWEIFLLPGGQDLELPPHQPQDHPGPLRFPETP
ncbi:hypothetical protein NDU88_008241 [Pleurodeles waltl]|uniref:Uncharacterized protein n=1 Tax=Pleurodeles waltl TaxID=8319 RepID=A0AAV7VUG5_PLEWA|nr:hypothetical protein NDU88_008241 [Pleurodeles waltl]